MFLLSVFVRWSIPSLSGSLKARSLNLISDLCLGYFNLPIAVDVADLRDILKSLSTGKYNVDKYGRDNLVNSLTFVRRHNFTIVGIGTNVPSYILYENYKRLQCTCHFILLFI